MQRDQNGFLFFLKKRRVLLGVLIVFGCGIAGALFLIAENASHRTLSLQPVRREQIALAEDSDNDGLKDWEEQVFRTDPHNPDTDGDGVPDGTEVATGRDPTIKESKEEIAAKKQEQKQGSERAEEQINFTQRLTDQLQKKYLIQRLTNPDAPLDPNAVGEQIVQQALNQAQILGITRKFIASDVPTEQETTPETIAAYTQAINASASDSIAVLQTPKAIALLFTAAIERDNFDALAELDDPIAAYDRFFERAGRIRVPSGFVALHLDYLNTASRQQEGLKKMRRAQEDSVGAVIGLREYLDATEHFETIASEFIKTYQAVAQTRKQ